MDIGSGRRRPPLRAVAASCAATGVVLALGACSSSGAAAPSSSPPPATQSGTPADQQTVAAISTAFSRLFGSSAPFAKSVASLQHGAAFAATIRRESKNSYAQKSAARVTSVRLLSSDLAAVTFSISSGGQTLLPNSKGNAVKEDGTWKVAARTFCGLLQLQGNAPKACNDPKITALPR